MNKICCEKPDIIRISNRLGYMVEECNNCGKIAKFLLGRELKDCDDFE